MTPLRPTALAAAAQAVVAALLIVPGVQAQDASQRIEITGSSIKRIDAETAVPVQVIARQDIQKSGATNVEQLMQTISAAARSSATTCTQRSAASVAPLIGIDATAASAGSNAASIDNSGGTKEFTLTV